MIKMTKYKEEHLKNDLKEELRDLANDKIAEMKRFIKELKEDFYDYEELKEIRIRIWMIKWGI